MLPATLHHHDRARGGDCGTSRTTLVVWLRAVAPNQRLVNRRAIREPDDRDAYWVNAQRRLAESDAAFLTRYDPYPSADRPRQ